MRPGFTLASGRSVVDGARRATAHGDGVAVDGPRARRTQEGDDEGHLLGIDHESTVTDKLGRPVPLLPYGDVIREALA